MSSTVPSVSSTSACSVMPIVSSTWAPTLQQGPFWHSFEQLRVKGSTALDSLKPGQVGTLSLKSGLVRLLREDDFQKLLGLASEVHRIKTGVTIIVSAAKVVQTHRDEESVQLLIKSVSLLGESSILPEHKGHDRFEITPEEAAGEVDEVDLTSIPRPEL